jgi:hypothetical protein
MVTQYTSRLFSGPSTSASSKFDVGFNTAAGAEYVVPGPATVVGPSHDWPMVTQYTSRL